MISRRSLLATALVFRRRATAQTRDIPRIYLDEYQPKSMLVVEEHKVNRARFPVIDVHTHMSFQIFGRHQDWVVGPPVPANTPANAQAAYEQVNRIIRRMDDMNLQTCVDLTGGSGEILKQNIADLQVRYKGRFLVCTEPAYSRYPEPGFAAWQAEEIGRAKRAGREKE